MKTIYYKGLTRARNGALETSTFDLVRGMRIMRQTLPTILNDKKLDVHTSHVHLPNRLCVSHPTKGFPDGYHPEGILFRTTQVPAYCVPFDLLALTTSDTLTSEDYNAAFLPDYKRFVFPNLRTMEARYAFSEQAIRDLNQFRGSHGLKPVKEGEMRYNEVCFEGKAVQIEPIALIGKSEEIREQASLKHLQRYESIQTYILSKKTK